VKDKRELGATRHLCIGDANDGEGLVHLKEVNLVGGEAGTLQRKRDGKAGGSREVLGNLKAMR